MSFADSGDGDDWRHSRLPVAVQILPGLFLAALAATIAHMVGRLTPVPAVLASLLIGLLTTSIVHSPVLKPGLDFCAKQILRLGVALLGAQITLQEFRGIGIAGLSIAVGCVLLSLIGGYLLAKRLRLANEMAWITAAAVAICGASAAAATAAALPSSKTLESNAATCVAGVTLIGTVAMLVYPALALLLGLEPHATGVFLGASLHEVIQAVGAGFSLSDEIGETASAVKLARVACLAPAVMFIAWRTRRGDLSSSDGRPPLLPGFLVGFIGLAALTSLEAIPAVLLTSLAEMSRGFMLTAMVALGAKISVTEIRALGFAAPIALVAQTLLVASLALGGVLALTSP